MQAGLPPPAPYPQTAAGKACCRTHFSAWQAIYKPEQGTHFYTSWTAPLGLRGKVPPKRAGTEHMELASCSSSPWPWQLASHGPPRSGVDTKVLPHRWASFPYQELMHELNKLALNCPTLATPSSLCLTKLTAGRKFWWMRWPRIPSKHQNWKNTDEESQPLA